MTKVNEIVGALKKYGCCKYYKFTKVDCQSIVTEIQSAINKNNVYLPQLPTKIDILKASTKKEMEEYQALMSTRRISTKTLSEGEDVWRKKVPLVTIKDPLYNLKIIPHLVLNEEVSKIASNFLGGPAKITFIKVKKTYGNKNIFSSDQRYHHDDNSDNFIKVIIYLSNVEAGDGAFHYVKNSKADYSSGGYYISDSDVSSRYPKENILEFTGKAGSAIFADTLGLHKAGISSGKDRFALLVSYGLEREYNGHGKDQVIKKELYESLSPNQKKLCEFMDIKD
jgi:hypothetical protein